MTEREFSDGFDTLASSYRRFKDFDKKEELDSIEFDEFEKSSYLTIAQDEFVLSLYNGRNPYREGFEQTEELRRALDALVKTKSYSIDEAVSGEGVSSNSVFFQLPDDMMFIVLEHITLNDDKLDCANGSIANVYPITHDEYLKIRKNPFRGPTLRKALRLDAGEGKVEIISEYSFETYFMRYLSQPEPIILEDLPEDLTIKGQSKMHGCLLPEQLHRPILQRAVQMALASKGLTLNNNS